VEGIVLAASIPTVEPAEFTVGDTVQWTIDLSDYLPADGWVLSYAFVTDGDQEDETTSEDNGDGTHLVTITAAESVSWTAATYKWQAYVTKSTERYQVREGTITARVNFASQTSGYDARSHIKTTLDALEAIIAGKASDDQMSVSIAGRSVSKYSPAELITWRDHYKKEYARELKAEKLAAGTGGGSKIRIRFTND